MASVARTNFLAGLSALKAAVDIGEVRASDPTGDFLRRGVTVAAFNLLETFILDRLEELAPHANSGATQFLDLPDRLQKRAIQQPIAVAAARSKRLSSAPLAELRAFSSELGGALSATSRSLALSPYLWMWQGSNMGAEDYSTSLRYMHVDKPWETIRSFGARIGLPSTDYAGQPLDLKQDLNELAMERHKCAHVASYGVTTIWLRTVPDRVLRYASSFDIFASLGANLVRSGDAAFFADDTWLNNVRVSIRFIKERKEGFFETKESARRYSFKDPNGDVLFAAAATRCGDLEVLIRQDSQAALVNWAVPAVDF